jgi:hypothetical protein
MYRNSHSINQTVDSSTLVQVRLEFDIKRHNVLLMEVGRANRDLKIWQWGTAENTSLKAVPHVEHRKAVKEQKSRNYAKDKCVEAETTVIKSSGAIRPCIGPSKEFNNGKATSCARHRGFLAPIIKPHPTKYFMRRFGRPMFHRYRSCAVHVDTNRCMITTKSKVFPVWRERFLEKTCCHVAQRLID